MATSPPPTSAPKPRVSTLQRWLRRYTGFAVFTFNVLVVIMILNIIFGLQNWSKIVFGLTPNDPVTEAFGDRVYDAYPTRSHESVRELLRETWSRPVRYQDFTHFGERPVTGTHVNVHEAGFRASSVLDQTRGFEVWPPDARAINVFVFGGSTTFGYGVADHETIPAYLMNELNPASADAASAPARPVRVYNFGAGFYYSAQERIAFQELLVRGFKPDVAVFIDGLNEFAADNLTGHAWSSLSREYLDAVAYRPTMFHFSKWFGQTPLGRAAGRLIKRPAPSVPATTASSAAPLTPQQDAASKIARYLANIEITRSIALGAGVRPLFVWQPVPHYRHDLKNHVITQNLSAGFVNIREGHETMDRLTPKPADLLWLGDLQESHDDRSLYVDRVHYNASMHELIAKAIAPRVRELIAAPAR